MLINDGHLAISSQELHQIFIRMEQKLETYNAEVFLAKIWARTHMTT